MESPYSSNVAMPLASPSIDSFLAIIVLVIYMLIYVVPFYLFSSTRPTHSQYRDTIAVIRARAASVTRSCCICSSITWLVTYAQSDGSVEKSLHLMGYLPVGFIETMKVLLLTAILFLGPIFEEGYVEGEWKSWISLREIYTKLTNWVAWRNYVVGPITEEILFRSASIPIFVISHTQVFKIILLTPVIFGMAHFHHLYEFHITHPNSPLSGALLRTLLQIGYTTAFGAYATFIYLRTGSLLSIILVHAFCNWMGFPRLWGLVGENTSQIEDGMAKPKKLDDFFLVRKIARKTFWCSIIYYGLLVAGAWGWCNLLWPLTKSENHLVSF